MEREGEGRRTETGSKEVMLFAWLPRLPAHNVFTAFFSQHSLSSSLFFVCAYFLKDTVLMAVLKFRKFRFNLLSRYFRHAVRQRKLPGMPAKYTCMILVHGCDPLVPTINRIKLRYAHVSQNPRCLAFPRIRSLQDIKMTAKEPYKNELRAWPELSSGSRRNGFPPPVRPRQGPDVIKNPN